MKHFVLILLLIPSIVFAGKLTCPDLSEENHENPLYQGWEISFVSPSQNVSGAKVFSDVKITNRKVARTNSVLCTYTDPQSTLILQKFGKYSHAPLSDIWYSTYEYDQCDIGIQECEFVEYR